MRHDGQHEVARNFCCAGTFSTKSLASSIAHVRARRDLDHVGKAELLHCRDKFRHGHVLSKLPHKRRCDDGNDGVSFRNGADNLKNLALIDDGSKWAAHKALPAGNAAIIINPRLAVFVKPDGVHAARRLTGALDERDGVVGAGARAPRWARSDNPVSVHDRLVHKTYQCFPE